MDYTVGALARLAGVSVRTLHHYDAIGLLQPTARSEAGYRLYSRGDLLRLQQILLYRELEVPLSEIQAMLSRPDYDLVTALEHHRRLLAARTARYTRVIATIDRTLGHLKGTTMLRDDELYEGLSREQIGTIQTDTEERWGGTPEYAESRRRVGRMSREKWAAVKAEAHDVDTAIAAAMSAGNSPDSDETQALMVRKWQVLTQFYDPHPELFAGLGRLYVEHDGFRAFYEQIAPGLAEYLREAMGVYAERLEGGG